MSRSTRSSILLLVSVMLLLSTATISAFNITRILQRYPDFARFNSLLSQTYLAEEINHRKTITVLALTDDRIGDLSGKPEDVAKRILSTHVILDYYDVLKLNKLRGNKTVMTTLYQATGTADDQQGFLNVAHNNDGIFFGSAMRGAPIDSKLEGSVASQPYDISVLSISHPIVAPGIDGTWRPISAPPPKATAPAPKASAAPKVPPPAETPEDDLPADAPAAYADAPAAYADASAPADAPASAPGSDAEEADADPNADNQSPPRSAATGKKVVSGVSIGLIATTLISWWM
ncbi:hypothetical protein OROHE_013631 [Orobanche hederae]